MPNHEACCESQTMAFQCPICGNAGRKVMALTLDHHVPHPQRAQIGNDAAFCLNPDCDVVYYASTGIVVYRGETIFPVTNKDPGDHVLVCYCLEYKRGDIRRDLEAAGSSDVLECIKRGIKEGRCDCERKNPQGACCLGIVAAEIDRISRTVQARPKDSPTSTQ